MDGDILLCDNLIKWLQTLDLQSRHNTPLELSDGVAIAEALTQIAPEYFTPTWNIKIKTDVGNNWRLKVSNLKKILDGVVDYHQDILNLSLQEYIRPDVVNIAERGDKSHLGKMLQLVLSCAVNCNQKEEYITRIMDMEVSCQRAIMQAIQELEMITLGPNKSSLTFDGVPANRFQADLEARDTLAQRCHELDIKLKVLEEEKATLMQENSELQARLYESELDEPSLGVSGNSRLADLRRQVQALNDRLLHAETQRDDYRERTENLSKELTLLKLKNEELQIAASETTHLKDEVDALRESAERARAYEATIDSYKKKLEELVDLKRQVRILESKNVEHVQRSIEYEEDAKKLEILKGQLEIYKKQVTDLNEKLDAEMSKADRFEIENRKLSNQMLIVQRERDTFMHERDTLRETCDELRCSNIQTGASEDNVSRELIPSELKERVIRLEHENKLLRQNQGQQTDIQALLEEYASKVEKLRTQNRESQQRIMHLETEQGNDDSQRRVAALEALLAEERRKVGSLQETVANKEAEIAAVKDQYKHCLEKAKEVIKTLDPKTTGQQSLSEVNKAWRNRSGASGVAEVEDKLVSFAWYNLAARCHRDAVEQRAALLAAGTTFMARQRHHTPNNSKAYKAK